MLSLPRTMAPARRSRATTVASAAGIASARMREPPVVRTPCVLKRSLRPRGTPCSAPIASPATRAASAAAAAARAWSAQTVMKARRMASRASMRSRCALTTSTGETSLAATRRARSPTERQTRSCTSEHSILDSRLEVAEQEVTQRSAGRRRLRDQRAGGAQFGVGPLEAGGSREPAKLLEIVVARARRHDHEDSGSSAIGQGPRASACRASAQRDSQDLFDGGGALDDLQEPSLAERPHPALPGHLTELRGGRVLEDEVLEMLADRHDLVDGHPPLHAGVVAGGAAAALVEGAAPAPGRDVAVGDEAFLVGLVWLATGLAHLATQALGQEEQERRRHEEGRNAHVDQTGDRRRAVVRVERGEHQVA